MTLPSYITNNLRLSLRSQLAGMFEEFAMMVEEQSELLGERGAVNARRRA